MTTPDESLSNLEAFQDPGFLYPLLKRANDAAAVLSKHRYDGREMWAAKAEIEITHGGIKAQVEYRFTVRVVSPMGMRYFNLDEAEMLVERLEAQTREGE